MNDSRRSSARFGVAATLAAGLFGLMGLTASSAAPADAGAASFHSPSTTPAAARANAARAVLLAVTSAGNRLVAVGLRGGIVYSDDAGKSWVQAQVPVEVDLVAVNFATPEHGWAVGHRGALLETTDSGATWTRRFVDQELDQHAVRYYEAQSPAPKSRAAVALRRVSQSIKEGTVPSLLDVWFDSPTSGTVVGTFNTIFRTEDAGKTWVPWMDRTDNPDEAHFYAVRGSSQGLYMTGEKGGVWRLDSAAKHWVAVPTTYTGTFFGLVVDGPKVVAFGMRGTVFTTDDEGKSWRAVPTPRKAGIVAGLRMRNGDIVLADQTGQLMRSRDAGAHFTAVDGLSRGLSFSLAQGADGQLYSAGPAGVGAPFLLQ